MEFFSQLTLKRPAWLLLAASVLGLEFAALYFQYGMGLEPCVMCIYQRVVLLPILFASLIAAFNPNNVWFRLAGFAGWGIGSFWGYHLASQHIEKQTTTDPFSFSCEVLPNFPSFMPLHEWFPSLFAATGSCDSIDWLFLGISMPGWMQIIFAGYALLFTIVFGCRVLKHQTL